MDIIRQYNQIGKDYMEGKRSFFSAREDWGSKLMIEKMEDMKDKIVLDMGCGDGSDSLKYIDLGAKVIGVDPSEYMVEQARKSLGDRAEVLLGDYEKIPQGDEAVDMLVGRYSLHYLKDFNCAYTEICRVLKPGGFFVLLLPHPIGDIFMAKEKDDNGNDIVCVPLYGGKVTVKYPTHSYSQYLSEEFFKLFNLEAYYEFTQAETDPDIKVPTAMVIKARKK